MTPSPRRFFALVGLVATALAWAPGARAAPDDPPKKPKEGGFRFAPPDDGKSTPPSPTKPTDPGATLAPRDPLEPSIRALSTWPGPEGVKAAESLLLGGPESVDSLVRAIASGNPAVRPGAAWVLGKIGTRDHVPLLLRAAAEQTSGSRLEVFFQAAQELDVGLTKRWLFSFLNVANRPTFRARATDFLAGIVTAEDRPKIDGLLASRDPGVRVAAFELLSRLEAPDVVDRLLDALPDVRPEVARRAADLLARRPTPDVAQRLNSLVREGDARQRAYATLALVEMGRRERKNVFEPATIPELTGRRGLAHPDKLSRGAAAVGLVFGALDSPDKNVAGLLDQHVIEVLVDTVGGDHFLDYASLVEPVFSALRRVSGLDLPATARPWAQWWQENTGKFRARRTLAGVSREDAPHARVVFDVVDAEGRRRRIAFVGEGGEPVESAYVLPRPAFEALVAGIDDAGLFKQPDDPRTLADEHLSVRLGVFNQERRMVLLPSPEDARYATLRARAVALEEENLWQRYGGSAAVADPVAWRKTQRDAFDALSADARRATLAQMAVASFSGLPSDAAKAEALDLLDRLHVSLSDEQALSLLSVATKAHAIGPVEARIVELVAGLERPALSEALVEALSISTAPAATHLLEKTLVDAGPARVREGFADPRPGVRAASAAAAASLLSSVAVRDATARQRLSDTLAGGLKALLADPDPLVQASAAGALMLLGEPSMIERLEAVYREGDSAVKIAVAEALGRVGGSIVHPFLVRIVGEEGDAMAPVRGAALEAMAKGADPDSIRILAFYMLADANSSVQQAAEKAITTLGTPEARTALVDLLETTTEPSKQVRLLRAIAEFDGPGVRQTLGRFVESTDPHVADQAAIGLAKQNEGIAVPYLIQILRRPEEPLRPKALEALQDLTCVSLLVNGFEAAADQYEAWYRTHRDRGDRAWFRDALERRGYDAAALGSWVVKGELDARAVPVLLKALRDDDPALRRGAEIALRRTLGTSYGAIGRGTSRDEVLRVADRWSQWWANSPSNRTVR